jgi:membrane fusion protein, copper/silver efflux system
MKPCLALLTGATLLLSACRETAKPPERPAGSENAGKVTVLTPTHAVPDTFKAALGKVLDGYAGIHAALARDDLQAAKQAFSSMHGLLHVMPKEGLDSAAAAEWDSTEARIMAVLHPMASADSLGSVRLHFMDFSQVLLEAVGKFGVSGKEPLYHFHCPMARDNQGADWVQKDSLLANPYYGGSMPKCGELVKILKG